MRHGVIITCRMSSDRLPGKPLAMVAGRPLLWYVHRRLEPMGVPLIVATGDGPMDEPIVSYCQREGIACFQGSQFDVAQRVLETARHFGLEVFARVDGDCPFVDARLLKQAFSALAAEPLDAVTNLAPRTYPEGVSVLTLRTSAFADLLERFEDPIDRDQVDRIVHRQLWHLKHRNLRRIGEDLSHVSLSIKVPEDLERFRSFVGSVPMHWPSVTYEQAIVPPKTVRRAA